MTLHQSTDNGIIWKLDDDDKRRAGTDMGYMIGNGHYTICGNSPAGLDAEMARVMAITKPRIY